MIKIEVNTKKGDISVAAGGDLLEIAADTILGLKLLRNSLAENVDNECAEMFETCLKSAFRDGVVFDDEKLHEVAEKIKNKDVDDGIHILGEDDGRTSQCVAD